MCERVPGATNQGPLHPNQARRVVALSFLAVSAAWEEFVGAAFVRYLAGAKSMSGYAPALVMGPAPSLAHAYKLIAGASDFKLDRRYLTWGPEETLDRARLFLKPGNAFEIAIKGASRQLKDAAIIRNRVAHASSKSRREFIEVARRFRGTPSLSQGYSVGDLLLEKPRSPLHTHPKPATYLDAYLFMFHNLGEAIAP
jgi:hypothetical protein